MAELSDLAEWGRAGKANRAVVDGRGEQGTQGPRYDLRTVNELIHVLELLRDLCSLFVRIEDTACSFVCHSLYPAGVWLPMVERRLQPLW